MGYGKQGRPFRENPTISPYATDNGCILRITASGKSEAEVDELLTKGIKQVKESLGDYIITFEDKRKRRSFNRYS